MKNVLWPSTSSGISDEEGQCADFTESDQWRGNGGANVTECYGEKLGEDRGICCQSRKKSLIASMHGKFWKFADEGQPGTYRPRI